MSWISAAVIVSVVKRFSPSCRRDAIGLSVALLRNSGVTEVTDVANLPLRGLYVALC
jgi:hypothetical protein